jgi:hypothetical protein
LRSDSTSLASLADKDDMLEVNVIKTRPIGKGLETCVVVVECLQVSLARAGRSRNLNRVAVRSRHCVQSFEVGEAD